MGVDLRAVTSNYSERIQRLALFDPLFRLENKKGVDDSGRPIDYFGLGLITLLFFFENMLLRNHKTGVKELARYLEELTRGQVDLDEAGFEKLARQIIEVFRPPGGRRNSRTFYNWDTGQEETVYYSILKADKSDLPNNTQYYTLDEHGLELVFATREYYSEFQISINQLLLRKQLEKGEFAAALRQVDEMRVAVTSLEERVFRIRHEIQRNIVSEAVYQRYQEITSDINQRLEREDKEFEELQAFVRTTRERLGYEVQSRKEQEAYELVVRLDHELDEVHCQHRRLLKQSIELNTTALEAAQEALYYAGIDSFNFQKEITDHLMSSPLPLAAARPLAMPFLYLEKAVIWSPVAVFFPQRVEKRGEVEKVGAFLEPAAESELLREREELRKGFGVIMQAVADIMGERTRVTLAEVMAELAAGNQASLLEKRLFYDFWIILHQRSPLPVEGSDEKEDSLLAEAVGIWRGRGRYLVVREADGEVSLVKRYTIRNMELIVEG